MQAKNKLMIIGAVLAAAGLAVAGYFILGRQPSAAFASLIVAPADLTAAVQIAGKVKASEEVDLAFERGGRVVSVPVAVGQAVKAGRVLAAVDDADSVSDMTQAQAALLSAQIALEKMQRPPEKIDALAASDAVAQANDAQVKAQSDLDKTYDAAGSAIADAYPDMQTAVSTLKDVLHASDLSPGQDNIDYYADTAKVYDSSADADRYAAENSYQAAVTALANAARLFQNAGTDQPAIDSLLAVTYDASKTVAAALTNGGNLIDLYSGKLTEKQIVVPAAATSQRAIVSGLWAQINGHFTALAAATTTINAGKNAVSAAKRAVSERQEALVKLNAGAEDIDIRAQESRVLQAQAAYDKAASAVAKTVLRAPFDGVVAKTDVSAGEMAAAGLPAVSLVSKARYEIDTFVSEADIAKVAVGQDAVVTLDTFGSEKFPATVVAIDPAQTVVGGIGTYGVKLQFAKDDERVKSGMTANIAIVSAKRQNVLAVPASAIITRGADKFVLIDNGSAKPAERPVVLGITSADNRVEVVSGLKAGERVVSFGQN